MHQLVVAPERSQTRSLLRDFEDFQFFRASTQNLGVKQNTFEARRGPDSRAVCLLRYHEPESRGR